MNDVTRRALRSSLFGIPALAALLFIPAWTLAYWQAWLFIAVFVCASGALTVYLAIHDPKLLERRMNVGPRAERRRSSWCWRRSDSLRCWSFLHSITGSDGPRCPHRCRYWGMP